MRVIFAGTPEFARVALARLHAAGFEIALVLTQPDRPAGRGLKLQASAVKQWAESHGIPVAQPRSLRLDGKYPEDAKAARRAIEAADADVMVVAAYGLILPQWLLDAMRRRGSESSTAPSGLEAAAPSPLERAWTASRGAASGSVAPCKGSEVHEVASVGAGPASAGPPQARPVPPGGSEVHEVTSVGASEQAKGRPERSSAPQGGSEVHEVTNVGALSLGCLNIHASLLPRWRGAAPVHRAIEAGDTCTGVTIMQMDAGLDTGDMLLSAQLPITASDTTGSLLGKLADVGADLIVEALERSARGGLRPRAQPPEGISYARKIEKHEAGLDWSQSAVMLERRIRAFHPFPVAFSRLGAETIKFHAAAVLPSVVIPAGAQPGQVLDATAAGIDIASADGVLRALQLQKAGGKVLPAAEFLRGFTVAPGLVFGICD